MKEINNNIYSKDKFPEYETRVKVEIVIEDYNVYCFDIFSDCTDVETITNDLNTIKSEQAKWLKIIHVSTKEQDRQSTRLINKFLGGLR